MTIHHDKLAYGKISSLVDEFSEERLAEMAEALSEEEEECDKDKTPPQSGKKTLCDGENK